MNAAFIFRALDNRNYRLFFAGQGISLIGNWMQQVALSWLVYRLTGSAFWLGMVGFAGQIPMFVLTLFAGVFADRVSRHRLLIATQIAAMVQASVLAVLVLSGAVAFWQVMLLSVFLGIINAFDAPARQSFVPEMIDDKEDLPNAIALNSFMFNGARFIGPSVAGLLIAIAGEGFCFLINACSFTAVIAALLAMRIPGRQNTRKPDDLWHELREGFGYVRKNRLVRYLLTVVGMMSFVGMAYLVLMPVFAKEVLHGGAHTLGFLMAAIGCGALGAAAFLASRKSPEGLTRVIAAGSFIFSSSLCAFSFSRVFVVSLVILVFTGFGMMIQLASCNTIIQTTVDDSKRGRVMSMYALSLMGVAPFGSFLAGACASRIGGPYTLLASGVICLAGGIWFSANLKKME